MEPMSILGPHERCVRSKLQLFLRLWMARQKYEQNRPFGTTPWARLRFHLAHLGVSWCKIIQFQRAMGLDVIHFVPRDQFEIIYVVSAFMTRELQAAGPEFQPLTERWMVYDGELNRLGYNVNPFVFADICQRCSDIIQELERMRVEVVPAETPPADETIPMPSENRLRMAEAN